MPILEKDMPRDEMEKVAEKQKCADCGAGLTVCWGGAFGYNEYMLRCSRNAEHQGLERPLEISPHETPGFNLYDTNKKRRKELEKTVGKEKATALAKYQSAGALTKEEATTVLTTVWPGAPKVEVFRAALICRDYGLNPLMKHLFLIPFGAGTAKEKWEVILSIKATRLIAARHGTYGYLEDTPRVMTEAEQTKTFGEVDNMNIVAITVLQDKDGNQARGYGRWPKDKQPYGTDKGNNKFNMAAIRSERQAFDRLLPDALPEDVEVMDGEYTETPSGKVDTKTGEVVDGEAVEITAEQPLQPEAPQEVDEKVSKAELSELTSLMKQSSISADMLGKYCNQEKSWGISTMGDIKKSQFKDIVAKLKKGIENKTPPFENI